MASTAGVLVFGVALLAVPAALTGGVSSEAVPFIAASAALELVYFVLLARAYGGGEVSVIYPIARGSAPVVVLVFGAIALNESVSLGAAVGVLAIAAGVLLVGWGAFRFRMESENAPPLRDVWFGLAIGLVIASYTLVDSEAIEHADPIAYLALVVAPCALVYPFVARTRPDLSPRTALTAAATFGAFLMVLAAFRLAPGGAGGRGEREQRRDRHPPRRCLSPRSGERAEDRRARFASWPAWPRSPTRNTAAARRPRPGSCRTAPC